MYSKYQIVKLLENYFQNLNCFSWIKLIPVLIHLKYWYNNFPYLELPCLPHHHCQVLPQPTRTPLQHNPYHVLHRFPCFFLLHSTKYHYRCWIYQIRCRAKPITFNIKLVTDHNMGAPYFSQPYLCIQPLLKYSPKVCSSISVNFHHLIPLLLVHKIILTIPSYILF